MGEGRRDEELASSKKKNELRTRVQNLTKMTVKLLKSIPNFMTKMAEKPYPMGLHILYLYSPCKGVALPPPSFIS